MIKSSDSSDFVLLNEVVPDIILELRYYSSNNFVGKRINGYEEDCVLLTKEASQALKQISDELINMGYRLKIFDAYRPVEAVNHFLNWSKDLSDVRMKEYYYPNLDKSSLINLGYISKSSSHSRGSTVDLTLFDIKTKKDVDMGGTFDYFGDISHTDYQFITTKQKENRMLLQNIMVKYGFKPLYNEWWHFTLENEPFPDTYFTFPVNSKYIKKTNK